MNEWAETLIILLFATAVEGLCASRIARKFQDAEAIWKYYIPLYNVLVYSRFSRVPRELVYVLVAFQAFDLVASFLPRTYPEVATMQVFSMSIGFGLWAYMVATIAERLGQRFWQYLTVQILSAIAANFAVAAILHATIPGYSPETAAIPLWAQAISVLIVSLPFLSLAFDQKDRP